MHICRTLYSGVGMLLLLSAAGNLQAAVVTYNYLITGDVSVGEESFGVGSNAFGLSAGDQITAYGSFTADLGIAGNVVVSFGSGSGNTMTIDLNGTLLTATDDDRYGGGSKPSLTFNTMNLVDFDYLKDTTTPKFNSNVMSFDNLSVGTLFGDWEGTVTLQAVPIPAAVWLFGSGLLGLAGIARRKKA